MANFCPPKNHKKVFLLIVSIIFSSSLGNISSANFKFATYGQCGTLTATYNHLSMIKCAAKCNKEVNCRGFNIGPKTDKGYPLCELHSLTDAPTKLTPKYKCYMLIGVAFQEPINPSYAQLATGPLASGIASKCAPGNIATGAIYKSLANNVKEMYLVCEQSGAIATYKTPTASADFNTECANTEIYVGIANDGKGPCAQLITPSQYDLNTCQTYYSKMGLQPLVESPAGPFTKWFSCDATTPVMTGVNVTYGEILSIKCCKI